MESPITIEGRLWDPHALYLLQLLQEEDAAAVGEQSLTGKDASETTSVEDVSGAISTIGQDVNRIHEMIHAASQGYVEIELGIPNADQLHEHTVDELIAAMRRTAYSMKLAGSLFGDPLHPIK